jgi:rhodanese-related sulfurtransferase
MARLWRLVGGKAGPEWMEPEELAQKLRGEPAPLVIDVRRPDEFEGPLGHIDEAQNVPLDTFPAQAAALSREARAIVVVCHTDRRSAAAARIVTEAGGRAVSVLRGGMVAWRGKGL